MRRFAKGILVVSCLLLMGCGSTEAESTITNSDNGKTENSVEVSGDKKEECKHQFDDGVITKEASCSEPGIKVKTCKQCGETEEINIATIAHDYKDEVTREPSYEEEGIRTYTCTNCGESYNVMIAKLEGAIEVIVKDKKNVPMDFYKGQLTDRVNLVFEVVNHTSKEVQGVQGVLTIYDIFGEKIITLNCDFTGKTIGPDSKATFNDLGLDINIFEDNKVKLYDTDFEYLVFDYKINQVVYKDNDKDNNLYQNSDKQVTVTVTSKKNVQANLLNGDYMPSVEFDMEVRNNTEKDILGVQGTLIVKDLFGKEIMQIDIDFTDGTIKAGESRKFKNMGVDINQFFDSDVKLYNTNYEDMIFAYEISTVVYTDGTRE